MGYCGSNPKSKSYTLTPQSADITPAAEGMLMESDGTVREKGLWEYKNSAWVKVGSSTSSGVNYITNGDASAGVTGWATYADAAGVSPVDGTGGSPTVTFTKNTSSPLRGSEDFILTKDAANRQGEGASYDFTIAPADFHTPLVISFDYLASANFSYTNGDVKVFVYSKDGSTLIPVTPNTLDGSGKFVGEFQTEASPNNDYRLIFHVATTSTAAYTLQLDDIKCGPSQNKSFGVPATDYIAYTPTGSWTTNTTYSGSWRRVGDSAEYSIAVTCSGAPDNVLLTINLPSGHVIDITKLKQTTGGIYNILGIAHVLDNGVANYIAAIGYASTTSVGIYPEKSDGTYGTVTNSSASIPFTFGNLDSVSLKFSVPIVGWSSNVQLSDGAETRVVACDAYLSSDQTGVNPNGGSLVKVLLNSTLKDTHKAFDSANNRYIAPVSGFYNIHACTFVASTNIITNTNYLCYISINGTITTSGNIVQVGTAAAINPSVSSTKFLNAGDYVEIFFEGDGNNSVNTLTIKSGTTQRTLFQIARVSGPATIAASEIVAFTSSTSSNPTGTLTNSDNVAKFVVGYDTHAAYNASTGLFTAPIAGLYNIKAQIGLGGAPAAGQLTYLRLKQNGNIIAYSTIIVEAQQATVTIVNTQQVEHIVYCNVGDTLGLYINTGVTAAAYYTAPINLLSIVKVK